MTFRMQNLVFSASLGGLAGLSVGAVAHARLSPSDVMDVYSAKSIRLYGDEFLDPAPTVGDPCIAYVQELKEILKTEGAVDVRQRQVWEANEKWNQRLILEETRFTFREIAERADRDLEELLETPYEVPWPWVPLFGSAGVLILALLRFSVKKQVKAEGRKMGDSPALNAIAVGHLLLAGVMIAECNYDKHHVIPEFQRNYIKAIEAPIVWEQSSREICDDARRTVVESREAVR